MSDNLKIVPLGSCLLSDDLQNKISYIEILQKEFEVLKKDNSSLKTIVINLQKLLEKAESDSEKKYNSLKKQYNDLKKDVEQINIKSEHMKNTMNAFAYENNRLFNVKPKS